MDVGRSTVKSNNKMGKKYTEHELNYIINNYKTMSNDEIGAELELTRDAIRKKLKRLGLKKTPEEIRINYQNNKHKNGSPGIFHPLYGTHRPYELKKKLSELYKDKTFVELHGEEKAKEIKQKISLSNIGKISWNTGLDTKEILKHYKNGFPNTGKTPLPLSEEAKRKISIANTGRKRTDEWKKKYSESLIKSGCRALEKNSNWQDGKSFEIYPREFNKIFKKAIKERDGCCMLCNIGYEDLKLLKKKSHVHHINYDKQINMSENALVLCNSCHSKTNFNRPHWIKFFQSMLSERYNYQYDIEGNIIQNIQLEEIR